MLRRREWWIAVGAMAAVQAACGLLGATMVHARADGLLIVYAAAALLANAVLGPGWVWTDRSRVAERLLARVAASVLGLLTAFGFAFAVLLGIGMIAGAVGGWSSLYTALAVTTVGFAAGGAAVGMTARAADGFDGVDAGIAPEATRVRSHVLGGVWGALCAIPFSWIIDNTGGWFGLAALGRDLPLLAMLPVAEVLGGGVVNALAARDRIMAARMQTDLGLIAIRGAACCSGIVLLAGLVLVLAG